jgi:hypothetical protein
MFVDPAKIAVSRTNKSKGVVKKGRTQKGPHGKRLKIGGWRCVIKRAGCQKKARVWVCSPPPGAKKKRRKSKRKKK